MGGVVIACLGEVLTGEMGIVLGVVEICGVAGGTEVFDRSTGGKTCCDGVGIAIGWGTWGMRLLSPGVSSTTFTVLVLAFCSGGGDCLNRGNT